MTIPQTITLRGWAGYRAGRAKPSTGVIQVDHHGGKVTDRQRAALAATVKRAAALKPAIVEAILRGYPTLRAWKPRPKKMTATRLKQHVALWEVLLTKDHHAGVGYVSWGFECGWDPSGFHVLTHGDRIVAVGDSEVLRYPHADPLRGVKLPKSPTPAQRKAAIVRAKQRAKKNPATLPDDIDAEIWITLPVWAGFFAGPGHSASVGEVGLSGTPDLARYRRVLKDQARFQKIVLGALSAKHPAGPETVSLTGIHLHDDGQVGYELACAWDGEHGAGVVLKGDRVVAVGQASEAFG